MKKRFIPSIYLYRGNAVRSLADVTETGTDPVALAKSYCDNGADALMIFDMSETDEEHEKSLDIMKEICGSVSVSVIGAGNVKRLEDIKKILYTGCKKAVLDYSKPSNIEITEEASLRFGREKLMISLQDTEILSSQKEKIEKFVSALLLMNPHQVSAAQSVSTMPYMVQASQLELNKLMELLAQDNLFGVTGNVINDNAKEIASLKKMCEENGLTINALEAAISFDELKTDKDGLVPVVIQDYKTNEVLMVAYMNKTAFEDTLRTGKMNYYSRSRKEQWLKGETSGHFQYVKSLTTDCDKDTILAKVLQMGVACHTGSRSCFFNEIVPADYEEEENPLKVFENVFNVIKDRKVNPKEGSYTNYLFDKGIDKILKKLGEEATEIVIAAKNPNPNEVKYEISDFLYHMMVLMAERDITWEDITTELANR